MNTNENFYDKKRKEEYNNKLLNKDYMVIEYMNGYEDVVFHGFPFNLVGKPDPSLIEYVFCYPEKNFSCYVTENELQFFKKLNDAEKELQDVYHSAYVFDQDPPEEKVESLKNEIQAARENILSFFNRHNVPIDVYTKKDNDQENSVSQKEYRGYMFDVLVISEEMPGNKGLLKVLNAPVTLDLNGRMFTSEKQIYDEIDRFLDQQE